jgi:hypothetical protein
VRRLSGRRNIGNLISTIVATTWASQARKDTKGNSAVRDEAFVHMCLGLGAVLRRVSRFLHSVRKSRAGSRMMAGAAHRPRDGLRVSAACG